MQHIYYATHIYGRKDKRKQYIHPILETEESLSSLDSGKEGEQLPMYMAPAVIKELPFKVVFHIHRNGK